MNCFVFIHKSNNGYYLNRKLRAGIFYFATSVSGYAIFEVIGTSHLEFTACTTKYVYIIHHGSKFGQREKRKMSKSTGVYGILLQVSPMMIAWVFLQTLSP